MPSFRAFLPSSAAEIPSLVLGLDMSTASGRVRMNGSNVDDVVNFAPKSLRRFDGNDLLNSPWWNAQAAGTPAFQDLAAFAGVGGITTGLGSWLTPNLYQPLPAAAGDEFTIFFVVDHTVAAADDGQILNDDADGFDVNIDNAAGNLEYTISDGVHDTGVPAISGVQMHCIRFGAISAFSVTSRVRWRRNSIDVVDAAYVSTAFGGGATTLFGLPKVFEGKAGYLLFFNRALADCEVRFLESTIGRYFGIETVGEHYVVPEPTIWLDPPNEDQTKLSRLGTSPGHPQLYRRVKKPGAGAIHLLALCVQEISFFTPINNFAEWPFIGVEYEPYSSLEGNVGDVGVQQLVYASKLVPTRVGHHLFGFYGGGAYGAIYLPFDVTGTEAVI